MPRDWILILLEFHAKKSEHPQQVSSIVTHNLGLIVSDSCDEPELPLFLLVPVGYTKPEKPIDLSALGLGQLGTDRSRSDRFDVTTSG